MTKVKICGIKTPENALMAARAGADMLGLNFYRKTPRHVTVDRARLIVSQLRQALGEDCPVLVGVFVNAPVSEVRETAERAGLDFAQLSGDESLEDLRALDGLAFKAIRPPDRDSALSEASELAVKLPDEAPSLLLDAFNPKLYGGTGETASIEIALAVRERVPRLMLAGGLNPANVAERVRLVQPWAVDVASGVEAGKPGIKDPAKVRQFIDAVRSAAT